MVLIPTPESVCVGIILGVALLIPLVFLRISILLFANLNFKSMSFTNLFVLPSMTISLGAI